MMTPHVKNIKRIPCPDGVPLKRIHRVKCLCGHGFIVDLGPHWKPNQVLRCPQCKTILGKTMDVLGTTWEVGV